MTTAKNGNQSRMAYESLLDWWLDPAPDPSAIECNLHIRFLRSGRASITVWIDGEAYERIVPAVRVRELAGLFAYAVGHEEGERLASEFTRQSWGDK